MGRSGGTVLNIPQELTERTQWCTWQLNDGNKMPLQPNGFPMRSNDPSTFVSFDVARNASDKIAYVIQPDDGLTGIDLDNCFDDDGNLRDWAVPIAMRLDGVAFAEISPSGKGIKFITRGKKIEGSRCKHKFGGDKQQVEVFDFNRFWTITGDVYAGNNAIGDGQQVVDWICNEYLITKKQELHNTTPTPTQGATKHEADKLQRASAYLATIEPAIAGSGGHNTTFRAACKMVIGFDLSADEAFHLLWTEYNPRCAPEWSEKELRHKVESATKAPGERGELLRESLAPVESDVDLSGLRVMPAVETDSRGPDLPTVGKLPESLLRPPGIISDVIEYTLRTSLYPQPELALAGAISLMGTITGRKLTDSYGTRTNVYVLGLSPSGSGKEQARKTNKVLLTHAGGDSMIGNERIGSSAGMITSIEASPAILFQIDEIGRFLETLKNPAKAPHLYNVATVLMAIYGCSDSLWIGDAYADAKKTKKINQPHPCLYGTSVPEKFWESLTAENVTDGLLGRMMPFESFAGYVDPKEPESIEPDADLIDQVRFWVDLKLGGNLHATNPTPIVANYTADAQERFHGHMAEIANRRKGEDSQAAALWSRAAGKAGKLALIFAASRCPLSTTFEVELEDVDRAIAMSNWITRTVQRKVFEHVSENEIEGQLKRVLRILKTPMTRNELTRKTQWLRRRERTEILETLVESGLVETYDEPTAGRPKMMLKAV
jgi:hypothetical protein